MSSSTGATPNASTRLTLPRGEILGRYDSYLDAQKVVDYLADHDFPVASVSIIGNDLKTVERVTAKLSYPKVAMAGAAQGAMFGIFVGLILSIFGPNGGLAQILSSVGLGMAIWMIVGVVSYSFRKGKRDFSSSSQVMATNYDVVVGFEHAAAARQLASKLPMSRVEARQVNPAWAPPRQGPANTTNPANPGSPAGTGHDDGASAASRPGSQPSPPAAAGADQPEATPAPEGTGAGGTPAAPRTGAAYSDLPDGRPQYGIRVAPDQHPTVPAPGKTPEDTQAPEDTTASDDTGASGRGDRPEDEVPHSR
ncbi:general stress protein [Arthrobacter sp. JSM 101049]|uniref:general stress protein n=1 Tax=Arthrobacter sp. JSM 101049 TaxID=929097 RepID=UPI00356446AA